jgi:glyoxylase-like metal-dependent hydrolase (beta-lactamase superfamily II)
MAQSSTVLHRIESDIFQVRIPLPFALNRVNCYLLQGDDGWTVVDTGLNTPAAQAVWQQAFSKLSIHPNDLSQIVLTHVHPDHYGLAGWLQGGGWNEQAGGSPPVYMSPREAEIVNKFWKAESDWEESLLSFWSSCGVPAEMSTEMAASTGRTRRRVLPHPTEIKIIEAPSQVKLGNRYFTAIHMPGHSDGQLVFYDEIDHLMLSGDHVLLKITANIGLWPQTEPDPLGRYLASLNRLAEPKVRLALPGHGPLITDLLGRIEEMKKHHADRLEHILAAAAPSATVYEASRKIFEFDRLSVHERRFAVAETLAHLEYLVLREHLRREEADVWIYYSR